MSSSSVSVSFILRAINERNSGKSMVPLPCIHLVDHILKLSFCRILAKGAHDSSQLLSSDGAITILVEEGEGLLEFGNLLLSQLVCHSMSLAAEVWLLQCWSSLFD